MKFSVTVTGNFPATIEKINSAETSCAIGPFDTTNTPSISEKLVIGIRE
jgi:hypothetical protein